MFIKQSKVELISAFEQLMKLHQNSIFKIAYGYVRNTDTAMDITQNVFIKAFKRITALKHEERFPSWLRKIAIHESLDWLKYIRMHSKNHPLGNTDNMKSDREPESLLVKKESMNSILKAINELNPRQQTAVLMRYFEGSSLNCIANTLKCTVPLVKNIIFRSLKKIRKKLCILKENN